MHYLRVAIPESAIPRASSRSFQHIPDTYVSEINKVISVWTSFTTEEMNFRPHRKSSTVEEIMKHELLSSRRFFAEFLGAPEGPAEEVLPADRTPEAYANRMKEMALARLGFLAAQTEVGWLAAAPFFDVERERIWIFWRRIVHTVHHRTQLTVYLRLLDKPVPTVYGPTADVTWQGADPTRSIEAASRK